MGRRRTAAALAVMSVCALVGAGSSAAAQQAIVVKTVDTNHFPAVTVTVQTPTPGPAPDFAVKENGLNTSVNLQDAGAAAAIAVAVDTSNSMAGQKIADAKAAAARFVRSLRRATSSPCLLAPSPAWARHFRPTVTAATALSPARNRWGSRRDIYSSVRWHRALARAGAEARAHRHVRRCVADDTATLAGRPLR
jgi:hypothetical protein